MAVQQGVYRGVSAADRVADRRARLLTAGLSVWADPGTRTTMTAVCAAAGLSERYFYESFAGLDALLEAVMDGVAAEIEETSRAAAEAAGDDPVARVRAGVRAFVDLLLEDPRKGRVAIVESVAVPKLRRRRTELLRYLAHQSAVESRALLGGAEQTRNHDEIGGLLFIGGMAELVTAWLDGAVEATPAEITDAASRALLSLYR
ncbi:TetR/AcrR family transcriptional regulator [Cryptosporangium phraense]|uniref:TetR/AcrR family transcriptional regulator n=1 Tax=Cryptosporangium phraense TaxID=2593070 RepID=A0A545ALC1_9ACTN|nr:TetR/AcrR family transcriptional regulator [Cryptosporangium phraense]TQS42113.1 TetR/AcrR family transcriptional regulator [Cryptosporangium phraense]